VSRLVADAAGVQVASVSCDSGLEGKVGATAQCDVDAGGVKLRRTVEVNTVEGLMMNFDVVPVLTKEEVASSLVDEFERQLGRRRLCAVRRQPRGEGGKHRRLHGRLG
jgi:hypothetical protein